VPVTEKLGLIRVIDQRVLELAVDAMERSPDLRLAINLSAATFADQDWLAYLAIRLHRRRDIAERLTVEITESAAIADVKAMADFVGLMKDYGVRVAIDDFGAGYTSFRVLRDLDVDSVKIDGVFVQNMSRSADDRFFVRTMIDLAKHLGLKVVAEWVQDETTARLLSEWGCDYLQGALCGMGTLELPLSTDSEVRVAV
jgi:EAL domain-containing protein (putative c-di-GMP-specific phosphodiesterase class I)